MTDPVPVALPWYYRHEYAELLALFSDPERMPSTFDAWLEHAERLEKQLIGAGFAVARIWIRPARFAAWCKERNAAPDQRARLSFANEVVREHHRPAQ
jgi:hypothetical protein